MATPLTIEQVPIDLLRPDPANPRCIGEEELDSLERSIRQFGFVQPVLVRREDQTVIGGHQRLVAARRLGYATVPVTWLDLPIEQARLLARVQQFDPVATWLEEVERDRFQELRWGSLDELASTHDELSPRDLPDLVRQLLREGRPLAPIIVGV
jgi:ParB-like chromosome segregation protein Spo0J